MTPIELLAFIEQQVKFHENQLKILEQQRDQVIDLIKEQRENIEN